MKLTRCVRALGLLLVLGGIGVVGGCGARTEQGPTAEDKAVGKIIAEDFRKAHQEGKASRKANASDKGYPGRRGGEYLR